MSSPRRPRLDQLDPLDLENQGLSLSSILEKGKTIFLKSANNVSVGGESIDRTDDNSLRKLRDISIMAVNAIPGLSQGGVDVRWDKNKGRYYIIEVNATPILGMHYYPFIGRPRHIEEEIIDFYFPETKKSHSTNNIYFDYKKIKTFLLNGLANELTLPILPEKGEVKLLSVNLKMKSKKYKKNKLKRNLLSRNLNFNLVNSSDNEMRANIWGKQFNADKLFGLFDNSGIEVVSVTEQESIDQTLYIGVDDLDNLSQQ